MPAKKPARNNSCLSVVLGLILFFFFLEFVGEVAKHSHKQELWPLSGKRTVLVDSCRQISDANNLLIWLPYNPHSVCCLNIPLVWVVQIQQVLVGSFPVVWALLNCFIKVILKQTSNFWKRKGIETLDTLPNKLLFCSSYYLGTVSLAVCGGSESIIFLVSISILFVISCLFWTVFCSMLNPKPPLPRQNAHQL